MLAQCRLLYWAEKVQKISCRHVDIVPIVYYLARSRNGGEYIGRRGRLLDSNKLEYEYMQAISIS